MASASSWAGASFEQEAGGAGGHCAPDVAHAAERRQDHDATAGQLGEQELRGLETRHAGHLDVEQGHVGARLAPGRRDLVAAADLRDDLDVVLEAEQRRERLAHHRLVLGEQDADHVPVAAMGSVTRRRKPPSGDVPASKLAGEILDALAQAVEPVAAATGAAAAVVGDLGARDLRSWLHGDAAAGGAAVPDHVRRPLADGPASTASVSGGRSTSTSSSCGAMPAASSAARAPASSPASVGRR